MKKQLLVIAMVLIAGTVFAQSPVTKTQLNAGVGLSSWGVPVYVGLDFGVHQDITVGGELSYRSKSNEGSVFGVSANGNYHFYTILNIPSNWDFYAGLNLGYLFWSDDYKGGNSNLGLGAQIGGRYYFNDKVGINLEFGGGNAFSGGKLGVTFRL